MKLVVTSCYESFCDYCRETGLKPGKQSIYLSSYNTFLALDKDVEVVLYQDYMKNPVYENTEVWEFMVAYGKQRHWKFEDPH